MNKISINKTKFSVFVLSAFLFLSLPESVWAQGMMGFSGLSLDNAAIQSQQQEEQEGKKFLDNLNNKTVTCSQLKDVDFEKIGEYFMGQSIGDTPRHVAMNGMMKGMMGEQGEEQMHIVWGKRGSGCDTSAAFPSRGGGNPIVLDTIVLVLSSILLVVLIRYFWQKGNKK